MKEHKLKQLLFNRVGTYDDNLNQLNYTVVTDSKEIIDHAVDYFIVPCPELIYPSKSYAVAILYAHLLEIKFQDSFYESLNDPELFCGNDKFFVCYRDDQKIYDEILNRIGYGSNFILKLDLPQIAKTVKYFEQEFSFDGQPA